MWLPCLPIHEMIFNSPQGVWLDYGVHEIALIAKVQSNVAKAIACGAKVVFHISISVGDGSVLFAIQVHDRPDNPYCAVQPQMKMGTRKIVDSSIINQKIVFQIYDELNSPVISSVATLSCVGKDKDFIDFIDSVSFKEPLS